MSCGLFIPLTHKRSVVVASGIPGNRYFSIVSRDFFCESSYDVGGTFVGALAARWQKKLITFYLDVHCRIAERKELMTRAKTWKTWLLTCFESAIECCHRLI